MARRGTKKRILLFVGELLILLLLIGGLFVYGQIDSRLKTDVKQILVLLENSLSFHKRHVHYGVIAGHDDGFIQRQVAVSSF